MKSYEISRLLTFKPVLMKTFKKPIILVLLLITLCSFSQTNKSFSQVNRPYCHPTPGEISIMAKTPIPDGLEPTRQDYEDLENCGFNLLSTNGSINFFLQQFSLMRGLNLKYLVSISGLQSEKAIEYIKPLKNNKHFGGWFLRDEPKINDLQLLKKEYDQFYKADPDNLVMINLVGVIEKDFTGKFTVFKNYLEYIQDLFKPQVWSYDYYPISTDKYGKVKINYEQFYSDLEDFYAISKQTQRPFWAYCESMEYKTSWYGRPAATEEYLRFEAFSALAYGAQGIVYWTYGMRKSYSYEKYLSALVNLNGKKTKAWYAAQKVNGEIKKYNDVFFESKVLDIRHTGNQNYKGTRKLSGNFGPIKSIKSGNSGVIVSRIENKNKSYIVIVSRDISKKQNLEIALETDKKIKIISEEKTPLYKGQQPFNLTISKGGYVIFEVVE